MAARLPQPGSDDGTWGNILNDFLSQAHNSDGSLKDSTVGTSKLADNSVTNIKLDAATQATLSSVQGKYMKPSGGIPVGDLSAVGSASPSTFLRGDNTWATPATNLPAGGTSGQVLIKQNNTDYNTGWANGVQLSQSQAPLLPGNASVGVQAAAARADHVHPSAGIYGWLGTGSDGAVVFDGTQVPPGTAKVSATVYKATRSLNFTSMTISAGITLDMCAFYLRVRGILAGPSSGTPAVITCSQNGVVGGVNMSVAGGFPYTLNSGAAGRPVAIGVGLAGGVGTTAIGGSATSNIWSLYYLQSGIGGNGSNGSGGSGSSVNSNGMVQDIWSEFNVATSGFGHYFDQANPGGQMGVMAGGCGGSAGGGDGTNKGGAGGTGGNIVIVNTLVISGLINITAPGTAGGTPTTGNCGGGGGGGGGVARLNAVDLSLWTGSVLAPGGMGGNGCGTGAAGTAGGVGMALATQWA